MTATTTTTTTGVDSDNNVPSHVTALYAAKLGVVQHEIDSSRQGESRVCQLALGPLGPAALALQARKWGRGAACAADVFGIGGSRSEKEEVKVEEKEEVKVEEREHEEVEEEEEEPEWLQAIKQAVKRRKLADQAQGTWAKRAHAFNAACPCCD
jgi:hypothetical protein